MSSSENDEGKLLMRRFQQTGDKDACQRLFSTYRMPLWRFLLRLCKSESDAEDLSQRTWLRLLEIAERGDYQEVGNATFQTFLFTIARNIFIDESRRPGSKMTLVDASVLDRLPDGNAVSMEKAADKEQVGSLLHANLLELPLEQREVLAMWAEGVRFDEIADIVGATRNTVIGRKRYGIRKLRASLGTQMENPLVTGAMK